MSRASRARRTAVGVMTGTSIDAIDVAMVAIQGTGLELRVASLLHASFELGPVADGLRAAAAGQPMSAGRFCELADALGRRLAESIGQVVAGGPPPDLIAVHGQTVHHHPPHSWQLINPAPIAARFGVPVVCDLRSTDLACGGQGAPITPLADWVLFRDATRSRAIVNLGGFCNITVLPAAAQPDAIEGFDVCACNQVLDAVARRVLGTPFDEDGQAAARGTPDPRAAEALAEILAAQHRAGRSLGSADEAVAWGPWLDSHSARLGGDDLAASATAAVGETIGAAVGGLGIDQAVVAGGGARNQALLESLRSHADTEVVSSDRVGVTVQAREAVAMAVLGALAWDGVPVTVPGVTGASRAPASGLWWLPGGPASGSIQGLGNRQAARVAT